MYESFFGLTKLPFKITPDPEFIYWNKDHRRAASIIAFGIEQTVPITVVTGDIGTGKTTLIQQFLDDAPTDTTVGLISNFWSGMGGLYQWILNAFDIEADGGEVAQFRRFQDYVISEYAAGRRCVLIVDEAQNVSDSDLEQLRMLTNINSGKDSLLMLFLVGQQQLRDRLMEPQNRQIAQRVGAAFHLGPMTPEDTAKYVRHRIAVAGGAREIFDDGALARIHEIAGGVPRMINVVCELALVTAFGDGIDHIDASYVDEFLKEAQANGMIAHLPLLPEAEGPAPSLPSAPAPASPAPMRSVPRTRQGQQRIRLVSDPDQPTEEPESDAPPAPAAQTPEPEKDTARRMEEAMASSLLARSTEPQEPAEAPEPEHDTNGADRENASVTPEDAPESAVTAAEEVSPPVPDGETAETQPPPEETPAAPRRWRGPMMAVFDHALDAALVLLAVGAVYASVASAPDQRVTEAADGTPEPTPPVATAAPASAAPEPAPTAPAPVIPLDNPSGADLMERALNSGAADPKQAAVDYARAALRGEARAAYYLGQLFETGDGVNRDIALARAWYATASDSVRSARRRMNDLPAPEQGIVLAPAMPLLGGPMENGRADFVWSSGKGADPALYVVELAGGDLAPLRRLPAQALSAQQADDIGDATAWRVVAADPALGLYSVSAWQGMGATGTPLPAPTEVTPRITLHRPEAGDSTLADKIQQAFPAATVTTATSTAPTRTPGIEHAYEADAALAASLTDLIGGNLAARRALPRAPDAPPALPGEIDVILPAP